MLTSHHWEQERLMGTVTLVDVIIANGQSLSAAGTIQNRVLLGVLTSSAWTAASITFQVALDMGATFYDYKTAAGEVTIASADIPTAARVFVALDPQLWRAPQQVKVRSGSSASAVAQGGARTVTLVLGVI